MHAPAWLSTDDVCRHYHRGDATVRAVDGVSLALQQGEFAAIVGSSGSGKTTLVNLVAGLDTPTSGHIQFDGRRLSEMSRHELSRYRADSVGMMFQSFNLLTHQSALRNVELALYFDGTPRGERSGRAREVLTRLGLGERLDHRPVDLSGGEQQRVALARALVKKPRLLLADEPTGNLDKENSQSIARLLTELNDDGLTIIMVTHDLSLAERVAKRVIRMEYGKVVEDSGGRP